MKTKMVHSLAELGAQNTKELLATLEEYQDNGTIIVSEAERSIFDILTAAEELDAAYRSERQRRATEKARRSGNLAGRKSTMDNAKFAKLYELYKRHEITQVEMARQMNRTKDTILRTIRRFEKNGHV